MFRYALLLLVLSLAACSPWPASQPPRPDQLDFPPLKFSIPQIDQQRLENGIRLYLKEDHELPLVEMTLLIGGGSIQDPADKTGLSQLFATTLETGGAGTASPAELEMELETLAADLSVSSGTYGYEIDLSLQQSDLQRGVEILADLLRRPRFDAERMELARQQMLEAIRRKNDEPDAIASRLLAKAIFPEHPFGSTPSQAEVSRIKREDLLRLYQRYFHPDNLWLAVSGAVSKDQLLPLLRANLGDWSASGEIDFALPEPSAPPEGRILVADKQVPQTTILMGHRGISKDNPDLFALRVANFILGGGGFNSRMMREIRSNRGLAYSVYSHFEVGRRLPEMFIAGSETKSASTVEVVALMREIIEQMIAEPVSAAELELAKQSLINSFVFAFTDTHSIVSRQVRLDFYDYPDDYLQSYRQRIADVTIADVQRVAKTYLHPDRLQIVLVGESEIFKSDLDRFSLPVETVELEAGQ